MQVAILGPLEVRDGDAGTLDVAGARLRALLVRLALDAPKPVPSTLLIDAVWGDTPPADEANALQTLVSRLRRALGSAGTVVQSSAGYRLAVEREDVDAFRFESLAARGTAALRAGDAAQAADLLTAALDLWRGPALADAGPFAEFRAARLDELRVAATIDRLDADLALGHSDGAVGELEALAAARPLDERVAALHITALARAGRQADALQAYEAVRAALAGELGVDPSAELQAVHLDLLRGQLAPAAPSRPARRTNLKAQLTSFVGRTDEVERLTVALRQSRLVTLVGPGGAGKTRLACEAAAGIAADVPDGVWLVELASVTDAADVASAALGSLGMRETHLLDRRREMSARDAQGRLLDALAGKRTVLLLDNCEHLVEAAARLAGHLLEQSPELRVLTTSREPLGIFGETVLAVPPLGQPAPDTSAAEALAFPAVRLFADRAAAARPDFTVDDATVGPVIEIVRRLDGLPLAIELAAARLRTLPLDAIAARLSDRFRLLTGGSRTALPRHRTLRAVVEWSWDLLTPAERLLAERLAVFPGGVTAESAISVADAAVAAEDVPDLLASLVDKSLLQRVGDGRRLRMLETIREYGTERLADRGELAAIRQCHATYFAQLVREIEPHLRSSDQLPWMRLLDAEHDNVLAALRYLGDSGQTEQALELAAGIAWHWMTTGAHSEAATWLSFALESPGEADPSLRLLVASMLAITSASSATSADAEQIESGLGRLQGMSEELGQADVERYPLLALMRPVISLFSGDTAAIDDALTAALDSSDRWVVASALMFRANVAENEGDVPAMRASIARALTEFERLGERWGLASCLQVVGQLETSDGNLDAAAARYEEALRLVAELGSHDDVAWLHLRLAEVEVRRDNLARATELAARAAELSEQSGSAREAVFGKVLTADIARRMGDIERARELETAALRRLEAMPAAHPLQSHGLAMMYAIAARHELADGGVEAARQHLAAAYTAALGTRDMPIVAGVGVTSALFAEYDGDVPGAAERLGAAARLRGSADPTQPDIAELTVRLRERLGEDAFDAAYARGEALDRAAAIERLAP